MNYIWQTIGEYGQFEHGFVDVFSTTIDNKKTYASLSYLPQFEDKDQKVMVTILFEGEKSFWTEGKVKSILSDCEDKIKQDSNFKFKVFNRLEYMTFQTFYIKNLDNLEFGRNGDFSFI